MNYELKVGVRTKWLLIGTGMILLGWLMGSIGGWSAASFLNIFGPILIMAGSIIDIVVTINTMLYDFSDQKKKSSW